MGKILSLLFLSLIFSTSLEASVYLQSTHNYQTSTDKDEINELKHTNMRNLFFLGASYEKNGRFILGQSIYIWERKSQDELIGEEEHFSFFETGPRAFFYFNQGRNVYVSVAYHFFVRGKRTFGDFEEKLKGSSLLANFGIQRSLFGGLFLGFSLNYHNFSMSESSVSGVALEETDKQNAFFPALDLSYRF